MVIERCKVFFCFVGGRSIEIFVIFDVLVRRVVVRFFLRFVFGYSVEYF